MYLKIHGTQKIEKSMHNSIPILTTMIKY